MSIRIRYYKMMHNHVLKSIVYGIPDIKIELAERAALQQTFIRLEGYAADYEEFKTLMGADIVLRNSDSVDHQSRCRFHVVESAQTLTKIVAGACESLSAPDREIVGYSALLSLAGELQRSGILSDGPC